MAYGETLNPNRRAATLTAVTAIHLALGYALVMGLGVTFIQHVDKNPEGTLINLPPSPVPSPSPSIEPSQRIIDPLPSPTTPIDLTQPTDGFFPPIATESYGAGGTGIDKIVFPTSTPSWAPSFAPVGPKPLGNQRIWVTPDDYPTNDLRLGHIGITAVSLTVGLSGKVENCAVTRSSGYPSLDAKACAKLSDRAKFKPGTDSTGAVVAGRYPTSVKWEIPE